MFDWHLNLTKLPQRNFKFDKSYKPRWNEIITENEMKLVLPSNIPTKHSNLLTVTIIRFNVCNENFPFTYNKREIEIGNSNFITNVFPHSQFPASNTQKKNILINLKCWKFRENGFVSKMNWLVWLLIILKMI